MYLQMPCSSSTTLQKATNTCVYCIGRQVQPHCAESKDNNVVSNRVLYLCPICATVCQQNSQASARAVPLILRREWR